MCPIVSLTTDNHCHFLCRRATASAISAATTSASAAGPSPPPSASFRLRITFFRRYPTPHLDNCNRDPLVDSGGCAVTTAVPATSPLPLLAPALFAPPLQLCSALCVHACGLSSSSSSSCRITAQPPVSSELGPSTPLVRQITLRLCEIVTF
jgi:hypothetical protein